MDIMDVIHENQQLSLACNSTCWHCSSSYCFRARGLLLFALLFSQRLLRGSEWVGGGGGGVHMSAVG